MNHPKIPKFWRRQPSLNYYNELEKITATSNAPTVSCIIPAWNEAGRITKVLAVVNNFPFFNEIIIVDDGSTDATALQTQDFIRKFDVSKRFKLIKQENNQGKAAAVITGIHEATGEIIVLMDADLWDITSENIAKMLYFVMSKKYSMTILDRASDRKPPIGLGHSFLARLFGGERTFWKSDFEKINLPKDSGFKLEIIINKYFVDNQLPVLTIYCPNLNSYFKFRKVKAKKALERYIKMFWDMYKFGGVKPFYEQFKNIEEDRMGKIYSFYRKTRFKKVAVTGLVVGGIALSISTYLVLNFLGMRKQLGETYDKIRKE